MSAFTSISRLQNHKQRFALLTTLLVFVSLFGGWFDPATAPRLSAWKVGIAQQPVIPGTLHLFSFGVVGAILCYFLWRAAWRDQRQLMALLSAALLFMSFDFCVQLAISRPAWLKVGLDGSTDFQSIMAFANKYSISTEFLSIPDSGIKGVQLTFPARILAAYSCMSFGWLWFTVASLVALTVSLTGAPGEAMGGQRRHSPLRWAVVGVVIIALQVFCPLLGQYYLWRGDQAAGRDDTASAETCYRHAIFLDQWYQIEPYAYEKIGELHQSDGDRASAEARLTTGLDMITRGFYPEGMDWLTQAQTTNDPQLRELVLDQIAGLALIQGTTYYQQGAQGMAQAEWMRVLQARPGRMAPYYMMGRSDQDLAKYPAAREWYTKTEDMTRLNVVKAACMSALGDTYYLTGEAAVARQYYLKSLVASYNLNFRGMKSLLDDYYQ